MNTTNTQAANHEVLFQKLGNTWFIFSEIQGDMVYSALPEGMSPHSTKLELFQVIETHMKKVATHQSPGRKPEMAA